MTRVKLCGITHEEDVRLCTEAGADALGFVVDYPADVPWNLTRERAAELMRAVPPFVSRVAVVGGGATTVLRIVETTDPDAVQLHADEPVEVVSELAVALRGSGTRIVKALRIGAQSNGATAGDWGELARRFIDAGADAILLDSKTSARPAGTGATFDWSIAAAVAASASRPVILAGGLTAENVATAIRQVRPFAVDVISAVEDERHRKVGERVRAFVVSARSATAGL